MNAQTTIEKVLAKWRSGAMTVLATVKSDVRSTRAPLRQTPWERLFAARPTLALTTRGAA